MEFVDGVNLRQAMQAGRFTSEQALAIVPPVCEALQFAHDRGIVHRDIKPENLLLDKDGRVKIADFGIAKMLAPGTADSSGTDESALPPAAVSPAAGEPTQQTAAGTPHYMAPEQKSEPGRADHRTDIYSLGVVLYELLTGEPPRDQLEPPSRKVQIDVRLDEVVLRALASKPELRYQTAVEFRTQVESIASKSGSSRREEAPSNRPSAEANEQLSGVQRFFQRLLPERWFNAMRIQSRDWFAVCGCGHALDVWSRGGIRFLASGRPRKVLWCPACHSMRGHRLEWRGPGHDSGNATPEPEPTAASPFVTLGIGIVFVFLVLFIGGPIALAMSGGAGALIVFTIGALVAGTVAGGVMPTAVKNRRGFLKTFGTIALVLGLPIAGLGLFFFHAMFTESGGWNPRRPKRCSFR